jgi:hypothetical protein
MDQADMDDAAKERVITKLCDMMTKLAPQTNLRAMYGGTGFELEKDNPKSRIGGVYSYADYVSLELAKGASFDDPKGGLEGSGKLRRHMKLHSIDDVANKGCEDYLQAAIKHANSA